MPRRAHRVAACRRRFARIIAFQRQQTAAIAITSSFYYKRRTHASCYHYVLPTYTRLPLQPLCVLAEESQGATTRSQAFLARRAVATVGTGTVVRTRWGCRPPYLSPLWYFLD